MAVTNPFLETEAFFAEEEERKLVYKKSDYIVKEDDGMEFMWLIPSAQKNEMEPAILSLAPGAETDEDMPHEGEELLQVVPLRRLGKRLGCEKIILKLGRMQMQFVSNPESAYYKSQAFGKALNYIATHTRRCTLKEVKGKRSMVVMGIPTVGDAVEVLKEMSE